MLGLDENGELTYYYKDEEKAYVSLLENLVNLLQQKGKKIERLKSIIKEVREYIENMKIWDIEQEDDMKKILEILDKGSDNNE